MTLLERMKGAVRKMLGKDTIIDVLKVKPAISMEMENAIQEWTAMYEGRAYWLHEPDMDNPDRVVSLGLPALIASEKARMATLEMESEITAPMIDVEVENPDYEPPGFDENGMLSMGHGSMMITESQPTGPTERAEYLNTQYKKVLENIRTQLEYGCAKGGIIIKPYVRVYEDGVEDISNEISNDSVSEGSSSEKHPALKDVDKQSSFSKNSDVSKKDEEDSQDDKSNEVSGKETLNTGEKFEGDSNKSTGISDSEFSSSTKELPKYEIEFDFVQADRFYPLSFDANGKIIEAVFVQTKIERDTTYSRLEYHKLEGRSVTIENYAFKKNNTDVRTGRIVDLGSNLGTEIPLTDVEEWSDIAQFVKIDNVDRPLFAYFKMPEANTIDTYSPLGVSCYSRVVNLIKDADIQYSRLLWEYEGGELAIDVDRDALRPEMTYGRDGQPIYQSTLPTKQQRLFRKVDLNSEETYNVFSPQLRDDSIVHGLNVILMRIEDATGLSRGTLSENTSTEARTATEMKILKQRSFATNADIQKSLEKALKDTVYIMDVYCTLYNITPVGEYEISFEWDDSILNDKETEAEQRMTMIERGLSSKLEFRMWFFGETENQAKVALQRIEDEKKTSMETNIVAQQEIGQNAQGKDFSGDNNNAGDTEKDNAGNKKNNSVVNGDNQMNLQK